MKWSSHENRRSDRRAVAIDLMVVLAVLVAGIVSVRGSGLRGVDVVADRLGASAVSRVFARPAKDGRPNDRGALSTSVSGLRFRTTTYPAGPSVQQTVVADVNGDGVLDLASVINGNRTVAVQIGSGNGAFEPRKLVPAGVERPLALTAGDMNGDGHVDLVVVNGRKTDQVAVLIGFGNGRFRVHRYPGGHIAQAVIAVDLNGDGDLDVVTANGTGGVSTMLGRGDGTLRRAHDLSTRSTMSSSVTAADLDADGNLDLVVTNSFLGYGASNHSVAILMGNGDGTFQPALRYRHVGKQPTMAAVEDLNGDGTLDLLMPNGGWPANDVSVMYGYGDGTFGPPDLRAAGPSPHHAAITDLNGDGIPDVAVADLGTSFGVPKNEGLRVRLGKGGGVLGPVIKITDWWPSEVVPADLNADGRIDLVVPNEIDGTVSVLINRS